MDSRSRHLPALGSTAPSTLDSHGHPLRPGARVTLATRVGLSIPPPPTSLPIILSSPSFLLPQSRSPVSASLRFLLSQVFFFIWRGAGVCFVCLLALATFSVCSPVFFPHWFFLPYSLLPRPCALTVNVEPGSMDATTLVPSFLLADTFTMDRTWKHRN